MKNKSVALEIIEEFLQLDYVAKNKNRIYKGLEGRINKEKLSKLLISNFYTNTLSNDEVLYLLDVLYEINQGDFEGSIANNKLDAKTYYTEIEIENIRNKPIARNIDNDGIFTFHNVMETIEGKQYICAKISGQEFRELFDKGMLGYDFNQQRDGKVKIVAKKEVKQANINVASVNSIAEEMKKNKYVPTAISINITKGSGIDSNFLYDEENHTLTVSREGHNLALSDGGHRVSAILKLLGQDSNAKIIMQVNIFCMTVEESQAYIYQQSQQNKINKKLLESYKQDIYTTIASNINTFGNVYKNSVFNKIAADSNDVENGSALISRGYLAKLIKENFKVNESKIIEVEDLTEYLVSVLNRIYGTIEGIENIAKSREESLLCYPNMFNLYLILASELQNDDDWKKKLSKALEYIDFSRFGDMMKFDIEDMSKEMLSRNKTEIRNTVKEIIENV